MYGKICGVADYTLTSAGSLQLEGSSRNGFSCVFIYLLKFYANHLPYEVTLGSCVGQPSSFKAIEKFLEHLQLEVWVSPMRCFPLYYIKGFLKCYLVLYVYLQNKYIPQLCILWLLSRLHYPKELSKVLKTSVLQR